MTATPSPPAAKPGLPEPGGLPSEVPTGVRASLKGALPRMSEHDIPSLAAGIAFKIFLSLFPAMVSAAALFALVGDPTAMIDRLAGVLPDEALQLIEGQLQDLAQTGAAGGLATAGVLGGIWASMSAAATLVKGLNRVYGVPESRGFLKQRLISLALILALFASLAALLALIVLGPQLQRLVLPPDVFGGVGTFLFGLAQLAVAVGILVVLFAFVYWLAPNRDLPSWEWMTPGAVIGLVSWLLLSLAFTVYTQTAGDYAATYGVLAGAIITMLWLQLSMAAVLVGGAVNAEKERLEKQAEDLMVGSGVALVEPTTEPLINHATRPELPAPTQRSTVRPAARAAVAAAAIGALAAWFGRRRS